ncbi:MAG: 4a-hydroxytetrahydrobiopterin dehydratase [Bacteriovorax sp.]|nr:4a-hydroxytetrahydrobiopterin dehydratase [Bacteriovorax sp.]
MNIQVINEKLKTLPEWSYQTETKSLVKAFNFKSYSKNISFVNAVAWIANKMNHHPDLEVTFNKCVVKITTHDEGGLSEKDFELAMNIEKL